MVGRQLKPEPRRDVIELLRYHQIVPTAMIDVSDGLSSDLLHICTQSNVGCRVFEENIPIDGPAQRLAFQFNLVPITCALNGGEDYELLFTLDPSHLPIVEEWEGITLIGRIEPAELGTKLVSKAGNEYDLVAQGWQHS